VFRVQPKPRFSPPANPVAGRRFASVLLIAVGSLLFIAFVLGPVRHAFAARWWRAQVCTIIRSEVRRHRNSKGSDTFSPLIFYSYAVDDQDHRSDTRSFFEYSSGWESAQRIINGYRPERLPSRLDRHVLRQLR
jgi:hypothetical protein